MAWTRAGGAQVRVVSGMCAGRLAWQGRCTEGIERLSGMCWGPVGQGRAVGYPGLVVGLTEWGSHKAVGAEVTVLMVLVVLFH